MGYAAVRVADVDLRIGASHSDLGLSRFFGSAEQEPAATLDILCSPAAGQRAGVRPLVGGTGLHLVIADIQRDLFDILRHVAYLAGLLSTRYAYVHAAGLVMGSKGVLLIGRTGQGKSTLAHLLPGEVVDDDMLLVSDSDMVRVSRYGAHIQPDNQTVRLVEDEHQKAPIDFVFVLDRQVEPGSIQPIPSGRLDVRDTFDDNLDASLLPRYRRTQRVQPRVPVFRLGTRRSPPETVRAIEYVLAHF